MIFINFISNKCKKWVFKKWVLFTWIWNW